MKEFFREMTQFCIKVAHILTGLYGSDWEKRLEVFMQFLVLSPILELISELSIFGASIFVRLMHFFALLSVEGTASKCCPFNLAKQVNYILYCVLSV